MIDNHGRQNSGTSYQTSTPVGLHEELEDLVKTLEHHGEAKQLAVLLQVFTLTLFGAHAL